MSLVAEELAELADDFQASRESTVRRFVELHTEPLAAVFFSWKLKPTEEREVKARSKTKAALRGHGTPNAVANASCRLPHHKRSIRSVLHRLHP